MPHVLCPAGHRIHRSCPTAIPSPETRDVHGAQRRLYRRRHRELSRRTSPGLEDDLRARPDPAAHLETVSAVSDASVIVATRRGQILYAYGRGEVHGQPIPERWCSQCWSGDYSGMTTWTACSRRSGMWPGCRSSYYTGQTWPNVPAWSLWPARPAA